MIKDIAFIQYLECRQGRSYAEAVAAFNVSKKTVRRWLKRIERFYPGLCLQNFPGEEGELRFRIAARSGLCVSVSQRDVVTLYALRVAAIVMPRHGPPDVADKLKAHIEHLLSSMARATRLKIETQVNDLLQAEVFEASSAHPVPPTPAPPVRCGMLDRLRLAVTTRRNVRLVTADSILVACVVGIHHNQDDTRVCLRTSQGELVVSLSEIEDVSGVDDCLLQSVAA